MIKFSISANQIFSTCLYAAGIVMLVTAALILLAVLLKARDCGASEADEVEVYSLCDVMAIFAIVGTLMLAVGSRVHADFAENKQEWRRFEEAVSADSGYTFYYNGQAVSGAALGIDENDIGNYKFKYDPVNKTVIIRDSRD